jgi:hypothetical protein
VGYGGRWYIYRLRDSDSALTGGGSGSWLSINSVIVCAEGLVKDVETAPTVQVSAAVVVLLKGSVRRNLSSRRERTARYLPAAVGLLHPAAV